MFSCCEGSSLCPVLNAFVFPFLENFAKCIYYWSRCQLNQLSMCMMKYIIRAGILDFPPCFLFFS